MISTLIVALYVIWFTVTALIQKDWLGLRPSLRRWDNFGLVPWWRLFAPHPPTSDHQLLWRDRLAGETVSEWQALADHTPRRVSRWLWNPRMRGMKGRTDLMRRLRRHVASGATDPPELTMAYIGLLNVTLGLEHHVGAVATQFRIVETGGSLPRTSPRVILTSEFHALRPR